MGCYFIISMLILSSWYYQINAQDNNQYRLLDSILPSKYEIDLVIPETVFTGQNRTFEGNSSVTFIVNSTEVRTIRIHHRVQILYVLLIPTNGRQTVTVAEKNYNDTTEILTMTMNSPLIVATEYTLEFEYTGSLETEEMLGFYRSSYRNKLGETEYLVTTHFEPTYARRVFPCFDEPQYKANFTIRLTYPSRFSALSNTPSKISSTVDDIYTRTTFEETPIMSTYLVAFVVSPFTCTEGAALEGGIPHRICSGPEEEGDREFAVQMAPTLMKTLESLTGIKYGSQMAKLDEVAIPDLPTIAMENWGLITHKESALLWNEDKADNNKIIIVETMTHEFAHTWFGNLVTCKWWDYTFLNEGLARLYQYFAPAMTEEFSHWELDKHFNVEQTHTALLKDSYIKTEALASPVLTQSQANQKFNTVSYNKGASIFRMIQANIMGSDNFIDGIRTYLSKFSFQATEPEDLWTSLDSFVPETALPTDLNLSTIMHNWIEFPGHPVVTVSRRGNDVVLSQKRFLISEAESDTQYYVPITYTTSNDITQFSNYTVKNWLEPDQTLTLEGVLADSEWIVVNNEQAGFYRVNYDSSLWTALKSVLYTNHQTIDVLNRAQIVSDIYNFASSNAAGGSIDIGYRDVMKLLEYLKNETDYYPWYATIVGNNDLLRKIGSESEEGLQFITWMLKLMEKLYSTVSFDKHNSTDLAYTVKQMTILKMVCSYGELTCIQKSKELFADFRVNGTKVHKNLRGIVHCNAMKHSDDADTDFKFLWTLFEETNLTSEVTTILNHGLACTEDSTLLKRYLKQTLNATSGLKDQDFISLWINVYEKGKAGATTAMETIIENYDEMTSYNDQVNYLITGIAEEFYSEDQLQLLLDLLNQPGLNERHKNTAKKALESAQSRIERAKVLRRNVKSFFDSGQDKPSGSSAAKSTVLLVLGFLCSQRIL